MVACPTTALFLPIPLPRKKSAEMESTILPRGQSLQLRYRFVFHQGPAKDAKVGQRFNEYAKDPGASNIGNARSPWIS